MSQRSSKSENTRFKHPQCRKNNSTRPPIGSYFSTRFRGEKKVFFSARSCLQGQNLEYFHEKETNFDKLS